MDCSEAIPSDYLYGCKHRQDTRHRKPSARAVLGHRKSFPNPTARAKKIGVQVLIFVAFGYYSQLGRVAFEAIDNELSKGTIGGRGWRLVILTSHKIAGSIHAGIHTTEVGQIQSKSLYFRPTMTPKEIEDAKHLWKVFYARHSFEQARKAAQHIFDNKMEPEQPLFYPLVVSVYTLYANPFTWSDKIGRLPENFVPKYRLDEHRLIMKHRNKVYAHKDGEGFQVGGFGAVNQVRVIRTGPGMVLGGTNFHVQWPEMERVILLCREFEKKCDKIFVKLWGRYKTKVPKRTGEYVLNVLDPTRDIWISESEKMILR